jgi:hypothetical protein
MSGLPTCPNTPIKERNTDEGQRKDVLTFHQPLERRQKALQAIFAEQT